jgi:Matrixin
MSRAATFLLTVAVSALITSATPAEAARRTVRPRKSLPTTTTTTVAPTTTTTTPTTTTVVPVIPAAKVTAFEPTTGALRVALEPPGRADLAVQVTVDAIGFEEGSKTFILPVGVSDATTPLVSNPDTKYTYHFRWVAPDGTSGPEDVKVIAPFFPQPKYRGPVPVAGEGWSVLFTSDFTPTRRNPCAPIDVYYDQTNQQLDLTATIRSAVDQASAASGVPMNFVGAGRTRPTTPRVLIIDWTTGPTDWLGVARQANQKDARGVIWRTTLSISLASARGVARGRWETVVLHELGHILGLQHSNDPTSLMFSPGESKGSWPWVTTVFTPGDQRGLRAVNAGASGRCSSTIEPSDLWNGIPGP